MRYVAFDLDQTLADVTLVHLFLLSLTMRYYLEEYKPYMIAYFPEELSEQLKKAYQLFVNHITAEEMSTHPLGIIRPGIFRIMRQIHKMKSTIKSVTIYSNNRYLPSLVLVKDVINRAIGRPIVDQCIHWTHPCRVSDHQTQPSITKSWGTLKAILIDQGAPLDLSPDRVLFFDDQDHINLQSALQTNYFKVPIYQTCDVFDRISAIYMRCIEEAKVNVYYLYLYLAEIMEEKMTPVDPSRFVTSDLIRLIRKGTEQNYPKERTYDHGIRLMRHAIQDIMIQERAIRGGKRCTRRNHRHTIKKQ
jgi:hypothetical protein